MSTIDPTLHVDTISSFKTPTARRSRLVFYMLRRWRSSELLRVVGANGRVPGFRAISSASGPPDRWPCGGGLHRQPHCCCNWHCMATLAGSIWHSSTAFLARRLRAPELPSRARLWSAAPAMPPRCAMPKGVTPGCCSSVTSDRQCGLGQNGFLSAALLGGAAVSTSGRRSRASVRLLAYKPQLELSCRLWRGAFFAAAGAAG